MLASDIEFLVSLSPRRGTMRRIFQFESSMCVVVAILGWALPLAASSATNAAVPAKFSETYGKLPLTFEANEGQVNSTVAFLSRGPGYTLFLTPTEAVLNLSHQRQETAVVGLRLIGGNNHPRMVGMNRQATTSNYFIGNDPRQWHTAVAHYAQVHLEDVYPGVDMVYRGNQRQLEYDFVVAPGADPARIRLAFRGADSITIGARGELILRTAGGELVQPAPAVYQEAGGLRERIEGRYILLAPPAAGAEGGGHCGQVGFVVGQYDHARVLVIDPVLAYSTFLGGSGNDWGADIAVDEAGNAYLAGVTESPTFPGISGTSIQPNRAGENDVFVTKINAEGTAIVWSTFLGGDDSDFPSEIAVDDTGNSYLTGNTQSITFPGVSGSSIQPAHGGEVDAFVMKINPAGGIVYSTFLGGNRHDAAVGIAVDGAGNAYVAGQTYSSIFPGISENSIQPTHANNSGLVAFATKINAMGTAIVWSTFLGGGGFFDSAWGIAVDSAGNAYVAGSTTSTSFPGASGSAIQPLNSGGDDGFVTKINETGTAIVYSTFLGGSEFDRAYGIAVDSIGNAYVTGITGSANFQGVGANSIQPERAGPGDAFVTKINTLGTAVLYSTFLGGSEDELGSGIAVDGTGNAYVTGWTESMTFPGVNWRSIQPLNGGRHDGFVTTINATGTAIVFSTFLGGSGDEFAGDIAVDDARNLYVTGETQSVNFPSAAGNSIQPVHGGGDYDSFVTKISPPACDGVNLCLNEARFAVSATFGDSLTPGVVHAAHAVQLTTDTGYFWFFNPSNVEVVVKVLNGCGLGGHYWVFAGGLTNVNVVITVTDTETGVVKTYTNPPNTKFQPIQDTSAFASCTFSTTTSPATVEAVVEQEAEAMRELVTREAKQFSIWVEDGVVSASTCIASPAALCLNGGRFQVTAVFDANGGNSGIANVVQLTPDTGYLWFFGRSNVEVVVKVLEGCGLNGHYWVFAGGLTDVNMVITVVDTTKGVSKTYINPPSTKFQPIQDTSAFATCP